MTKFCMNTMPLVATTRSECCNLLQSVIVTSDKRIYEVGSSLAPWNVGLIVMRVS